MRREDFHSGHCSGTKAFGSVQTHRGTSVLNRKFPGSLSSSMQALRNPRWRAAH